MAKGSSRTIDSLKAVTRLRDADEAEARLCAADAMERAVDARRSGERAASASREAAENIASQAVAERARLDRGLATAGDMVQQAVSRRNAAVKQQVLQRSAEQAAAELVSANQQAQGDAASFREAARAKLAVKSHQRKLVAEQKRAGDATAEEEANDAFLTSWTQRDN